MKVAHLETGDKYDVWVICNEDDSCPVLDVLAKAKTEHPDLVEPIMALLLEVVPNEGPPLHDPRRAKVLYRDLLYELKADIDVSRRLHIGLRVAFFFDGPVVVCAHAFHKTGSSTPENELDLALLERARYFEHRHELEFVTEGLL